MRKSRLLEGTYLLDLWLTGLARPAVNHGNLTDCIGLCAGDVSFKFLPHQVSTVVYWTTVPITGSGGLGFDSGEGA